MTVDNEGVDKRNQQEANAAQAGGSGVSGQAVLACVDGSVYTDSVCAYAAWAAGRLDAPVKVLHVQLPQRTDRPRDLSGAIGLGAKSALLEKLAQADEAQSKIDQQKGKVILEHAREELAELGTSRVEMVHRRGALVEVVTELESSSQLAVLGKRGEHADFARLHLGSNLERVIRAVHKPVLVAARKFEPIETVLVAFDGGPSTWKAIEYLERSALLRGLTCHLLRVGNATDENRHGLEQATSRLEGAGFAVLPRLEQGHADDVIAEYVKSHGIDMLLMGAYGHSRIRTLIIGSTTSNMLRSCKIPVLMFR